MKVSIESDDSDNVKSIPGLGPVKASKLLKDCEDAMMWGTIVMAQYVKYFGNHYGPVIYQETLDTLKLMSSKHRLWYQYSVIFEVMLDERGPVPLKPFSNSSDEYSPFNEVTDAEAREIYGTDPALDKQNYPSIFGD